MREAWLTGGLSGTGTGTNIRPVFRCYRLHNKGDNYNVGFVAEPSGRDFGLLVQGSPIPAPLGVSARFMLPRRSVPWVRVVSSVVQD